jgi:hypothetical protein
VRLGMPYYKYLQTESWLATRDRVVAARPMCEICRSHATGQVHHLTYERVGAELDEDLVAVCRPCHAGLHAKWGEIIGMGGDQLVTFVSFSLCQWRGRTEGPFCRHCGGGMGKTHETDTRLTIQHKAGCPNA